MSIFEAIPHYNIEIEEDIIYRVGSTLYGDVNDIIQLLTITNKACHIQKKAQTIFDKPDTSKIANAMPTIVPVISTEDIDDTYVRLQNKASTDLAVMNEDLTIDRVERVDRGARVQSFMGWISLPPVLSEPKYDVSSSAIQPDLYYEDLDGMNVGDTVEHMGEHKRVVAKTEHSMDLESSGTVVTVMLDTDHVFKQGSSYYTAMMRRALYVHGVDAKHFFSNFTIHDFVRYALVTKRVRYSDLCKEFPIIFQHARAEMSTCNLGPVRPMLTAPVDVSDVTVPQRSAKGFKHVVKQYTARRETGLVFIEGDDVLVPEQGVMIEAIEADEVFEEDALHGDRELRLEQEMRLIGADLNALPPMIIDNLKALAKTIQKMGEAKIRLYIRAATIIIAQYQYPIVVIRNVDPTTLLEFPEKTTIAKLFSPPSVPAPLAAAYKVISSQPTIATYTNNLANKRSRILANMKKAEVVAPSVDQKDLVTEVLRSTIKTASAQAKCPLGKKAKAPSTFEWIKNKMSPNSASNVVASSKFEVIRALKETKYSINFNTFLYSMYRLINTIVSRWANRHRYDEESEESTLFRSVGAEIGAGFDVNVDAFEPDGSPQEKFIILFEMDTALTKVASMNERVATYITSTISARFARYSMTFDMIRDNYEQIRENDKRKKISRWENIDPDAKAYYKQANKMGLISYDDLPGDSGTGENEFIQNVLANQNPDYDPQNADADE